MATNTPQQRRAVRVGIVGTGWGVKVQVPKFREGGLEVTAIYSRSLERARSIATTHGIRHAFDSVAALASCPDVDVVSVVCPTHERRRHVLAVAAAGKAVLCEKPMALDANEADDMLAACDTVVPHWMDFELRCVPQLRRAKQLVGTSSSSKDEVDDHALGGVLWLDVTFVHAFEFFKEDKESTHWTERRTGGGAFSAVGTHFVDLVRWLLDDEIAAVSAEQSTTGKFTADSYVAASLRLRDRPKTRVRLLVAAVAPGLPPEMRLLVAAERGSMRFDFLTSSLSVYDAAGACTESLDEPKGMAWPDVGTPGLARALARVDGLGGGDMIAAESSSSSEGGGAPEDDGDHLATMRDGAIVQRVTDAVHASAACGGAWVPVAPPPPATLKQP